MAKRMPGAPLRAVASRNLKQLEKRLQVHLENARSQQAFERSSAVLDEAHSRHIAALERVEERLKEKAPEESEALAHIDEAISRSEERYQATRAWAEKVKLQPRPLISQGTVEFRVTDPPPPDMDHIWVTISNLAIHKAGGRWTEITVEPEHQPFDLKAIEGIEQFLTSQVVDAGKYTQIRLNVSSVKVVVNEEEHEATVPSGKIKIVRSFVVEDGGKTVLTLDFNGKKSVNVTGAGRYLFEPVIKLRVAKGAPALAIATTGLPDGVVGASYNATLEAVGGTEPYTWSISDNTSLPDGFELNPSTGIISSDNVTAEPGTYEFTVKVEDSSDPVQTDTKPLSITVSSTLEITTTGLPDGVVGASYNATLEAVGGTEPYTWSISDNTSLPEGFELNPSTGIISSDNVSAEPGTYEFTVKVEDSSDPVQTDTKPLSIHISNP
jgi:hypothetical protein